jgi:cytochrome c peroxidase
MREIKILVCLIFVTGAIAAGISSPNKASGKALQTVLAAPTGVSASDNSYSDKIGISWDAIRGATLYRVFRSSINDPSTRVEVGTTVGNTFFDAGAAPAQTIFYWVRAEAGADLSELSTSDQGVRSGTPQQGPVPALQPPPVPVGNEITATKVFLGKTLFWDEQMSSTRTVACGTCHHSNSGGTDPRSKASLIGSTNAGPDLLANTPDDVRGSGGVPSNNADGSFVKIVQYGLEPQVTGRRGMSYLNAGYSPVLFWDGRALGTFRDPLTNAIILNGGGALESQVLGPPVSTAEMAHAGRDWSNVAVRIADSTPLALSLTVPAALQSWLNGRSYPELFQEAFGTPDVTLARIALAIGTFERELYSDRAPVDLAAAGITPLNQQEQRGRGVFNASSCNVCHAGPLFTDNSFRYIGVRPQNEDTGRFQVTGNNNNIGEFRTPSLRNVELRGSYFHNGRFTTLEEVVAFYNRGGDFNAPNKPLNLIRPLGLNAQQQADLVAFLKRPLTDPRVSAETTPFDRPTLFTESDRVPQLAGSGKPGTGGVTPQMKALSPPLAGNPQFTVSVDLAAGNAAATLVISESDPGTEGGIPAAGTLARVQTITNGAVAGSGWASVTVQIPQTASAIGKTFYARWYIEDPGAVNGYSVTQAARFTVFGEAAAFQPFTIAGRVTNPEGLGLRNAVVTLTGPDGVSRRVSTSSLGFYQFSDIAIAGSYTMAVSSRRYRFDGISLDLSSNLTGVDFTGLE